jgi:hypothetical protein
MVIETRRIKTDLTHQRYFTQKINTYFDYFVVTTAWLAQSVGHETLNLRVVGSSPTMSDHFFHGDKFMFDNHYQNLTSTFTTINN